MSKKPTKFQPSPTHLYHSMSKAGEDPNHKRCPRCFGEAFFVSSMNKERYPCLACDGCGTIGGGFIKNPHYSDKELYHMSKLNIQINDSTKFKNIHSRKSV